MWKKVCESYVSTDVPRGLLHFEPIGGSDENIFIVIQFNRCIPSLDSYIYCIRFTPRAALDGTKCRSQNARRLARARTELVSYVPRVIHFKCWNPCLFAHKRYRMDLNARYFVTTNKFSNCIARSVCGFFICILNCEWEAKKVSGVECSL